LGIDIYDRGGRSLTCRHAPFCCFPRPFCPRLVNDWEFRRCSVSGSQLRLWKLRGYLHGSDPCFFIISASERRTVTRFRFRVFFLLWDLCQTSTSKRDVESASRSFFLINIVVSRGAKHPFRRNFASNVLNSRDHLPPNISRQTRSPKRWESEASTSAAGDQRGVKLTLSWVPVCRVCTRGPGFLGGGWGSRP
jgi:hypothetical protein